MKAPDGLLLQLQLLAVLFLCGLSADDFINLSVLDGDFERSKTSGRASAHRFIVRRATLDEHSRPSAVEHTLNSLRRHRGAANVYHVVINVC